ncbi:hypothetical protein HMPREF9350_03339 [Escherichia coli MS 85-1]|uniref:Uncharacterized protein n=1 Tax=Escherichia coli MS 85-1 TaxID=679202 RepID=A0AAN3SEF3_ECOLX|nr:hypothetical protein HMPREF9350_03339 [Escherichia coli MS 85-1]
MITLQYAGEKRTYLKGNIPQIKSPNNVITCDPGKMKMITNSTIITICQKIHCSKKNIDVFCFFLLVMQKWRILFLLCRYIKLKSHN